MTKQMVNWAQKRVIQLEKEDIRGFIFKSDSPSCGIKKVKIYNEKSMPVKVGTGIFAQIFIKHFPSLRYKMKKVFMIHVRGRSLPA
jgi:uncharacterized protein YbbK (DUF523 family)